MRKRALAIATVVSAVICVGSLLLVGRSLFRSDNVSVLTGRSSYGAITVEGQLIVWHSPNPLGTGIDFYSTSTTEHREFLWHAFWEKKLTGIRQLGIGWGSVAQASYLILPLWLLPILMAILPVRWWMLRRRNRRHRGFPVEVKTQA